MSENEAQERKRVRRIRYTMNTFDVNCNKVIVYFNHALAGPVKEENRKVRQIHLPILTDICRWVWVSAISIPPEEHDRKVREVYLTITIEIGVTAWGNGTSYTIEGVLWKVW
jgi:hypothetical protein